MSDVPGWKADLAQLRAMLRRLEQQEPRPPTPPPLPPGRIVPVPGRGEMFVRQADGAPDGPLIVLLHGWTVSADVNWFPLYESVAAHGPLLALDHRGHGRGLRSEQLFTLEAAADDVAALLRHLGMGPAVLVGFSMGGPISMLTWRRHRDVVAGLVLQATALEWRDSAVERFRWRFVSLMEWVLRSGKPRGVLDRYLRYATEVSPEVEPLASWIKAELRRGDPSDIAAAGRALALYDARSFAGEVDVPTAVVVTLQDHLAPPRKQRALAAAIPGARVFEVDGDHDAPLVNVPAFRAATDKALSAVIGDRRVGTKSTSP